jgi:hypothetical protein
MRGRAVPGKSSAELRHRAVQVKMQMRVATAAAESQRAAAAGSWTPLGPVPLASDASGTGLQDYHQVSGRATAVAIDPADPSGNTVISEERRAGCGNQRTPSIARLTPSHGLR